MKRIGGSGQISNVRKRKGPSSISKRRKKRTDKSAGVVEHGSTALLEGHTESLKGGGRSGKSERRVREQ